jgi:hypothetical protein
MMAEIKSAIELAMEKTAGFHLSREEKEKLRDEEVQGKAQGLILRFLAGDLHFPEVEKELTKYAPEERPRLEQFMIRSLIQAIHLDAENDLTFQGLEKLIPGSNRVLKKIRALTKDYRKRRVQEYEKIQANLRLELERQGISGSAVLPKVEGSPDWEGLLASLKPPFESQLGEFIGELNMSGGVPRK